ncbi:acetate--CoA ligase [Egicoccus sp. AB-alg6-2]|uniref:acetate--CoA ligase n=1 Tax=Egicoccus sp. AB-alg6-2 TaxID=3242692 RepID=UPI00359CCAB7
MTDRYPPPADFASTALITDDTMHAAGLRDREGFWAAQAEQLDWSTPFERPFEGTLTDPRWFVGGQLNASYNCLDRHVEAGLGDRVAYHWEGEQDDRRTITYAELLDEVQRAAAMLRDLGVERGDRVAIYLPMIPELPLTMLACARLGAAHSVVFGGFSATALRDRIEDAGCRVLVTADGAHRRGGVVPLKTNADEAVAGETPIEHVVVVQRTGADVTLQEGRDHWYHEILPRTPVDVPAVPVDSEQLLFLLYTSGTTAKPKGVMHTTAGYLTHVAATTRWTFDLRPESDVFWCAADIGWVTGHSYIVYGPLANGATSVLFEGTPDHPGHDRFWDVVERYGVTILYTAPTAIRSFMKWGREHVDAHDVSSLRLLGTVGEPINPAAWEWYRDVVGAGRCPVVDTWWQTETGGQMMTPLPGLHAAKPGCAMQPLPGISVEVVDEQGRPLPGPGDGYLTVQHPWPGMLRGVWGDPQRFHDTYFSRFDGRYFAGDGARIDEDGDIWILGRVDDVMNVAGHRISTAEVESALVSHDAVAEAAVVGRSDETSGQAIAAFVTLRGTAEGDAELEQLLRQHVATVLGPIAKPKTILFTPDLPKTRSGKIMRRLLRDIAEGRDLGDTTTLANAEMMIELGERASASR